MSMTGFGEGRAEEGGVEFTVELKSVNHRFLDFVCRLPSGLSRFEPEIGKALRTTFRRGRIEVTVQRTESQQSGYSVAFNEPLFSSYVSTIKEVCKKNKISDEKLLGTAILDGLSRREILELLPTTEQRSLDEEFLVLAKALEHASGALLQMRKKEGAELEAEVRSQLQLFEAVIGRIRVLVEKTPVDFAERLRQRLERLQSGVNVEPERIAQEVALLADRIDVTEELARLTSHISQFTPALAGGEGGRKLEFLIQEFGREVNTIGSKAQNAEVTSEVVEAKAILERIREQIQNIE